ncbi:hypothetical protein GALL_191130 [mine drainage metagenome]|uniref:Non-reducing end alpha-L-arabinofuranosidase n=1 Tax=mine drainage metagenome TaxID=410659 RepID=A0A1J5S413_9ZZZZ
MRPLFPLLLLPFALAPLARADVQVAIDTTAYVRPLSSQHFGLNTAMWDHSLSQDTADFQDLGVLTLRFPGGSLSDAYHWQTNMTQDQGWNGPWFSDYLEFGKLIQQLHARAMITVNYGSGTPEEAAAWVQAANIQNNFGFKYWEVGNECYGSWEEDKQSTPHDPVVYATRFADYYAKMKAVDPTIRIGAVIAARSSYYTMTPLDDSYTGSHSVVNPRTNVSHSGWTPVMLTTLKSLGVTPDFVIFHRYLLTPGKETDTDLLNSSTSWANDASEIRQELSDYLGKAGDNVEMITTENNSVSYGAGKQTTSLVTALFCADSFGSMIQTSFNGDYWWEYLNSNSATGNNSSSLYGWRNYGADAIVTPVNNVNEKLPAYYAIKMISKFARPSDEVVKATSDNPLLSCYAVRHTDGSVGLLVVNKSPDTTETADFSIAHFNPGATATTYTYGIPQDNAARDGTGSTDVASGVMAIPGAVFSASFDPYSINVIDIPPAVAPSGNSRLIALSARGYVGGSTDTNPSLTIGYAVSGTKSLLLRGIGPTLATQSVNGVLADPKMVVYKIQNNIPSVIGQNDNWGGDPALAALFTKLGEFSLDPASKDAALQLAAPGGLGTAEITSGDGTPGVALGEIYSADSTQSTYLSGLSARAIVGTGDNVLVGGFIITGSSPMTVLIRGIGPTLSNQGISNPLADPKLTLFDVHGNIISENDDWGGSQALVDAFTKTGEFPLDPLSKDAAILITLPPGIYTAQVSPAGGTAQVPAAGSPSGVALVEIYQVK